MSDNTEIEDLRKELTELKKKPNFFSALPVWAKLLTSIVAIGIALGTIGTATISFIKLIYHEEISEYEKLKSDVNKHSIQLHRFDDVDSLITVKENEFRNAFDSLSMTVEESVRAGAEFYAVGYRASVDEDGRVQKYYRDWDGELHKIFPDPEFSDASYTYYFYTNDWGYKVYCFTQ